MGTTPAPPCFSDVVEAQNWALKVTQEAEEEANRRGGRGSPAWEDAWRDALWTLAVQKRCVEVEARRLCCIEPVPPPLTEDPVPCQARPVPLQQQQLQSRQQQPVLHQPQQLRETSTMWTQQDLAKDAL